MAEGTRIKDLDEQATRSSVLRIPVDHSSLDDAKYITIETLTPLISEESSQSIGNRATDIIRWNDGAGNEYYTTINDIYKLIDDLTIITSLGDYDKIRVADYSDSFTEKGVSLDSLVDFIAADGALTSMADARIAAQRSTVTAQALVNGGTTYGYLSMQKFGNIVVGQVSCDLNTTTPSTLDMDYAIPSAYCPSNCGGSVDIGLTFQNLEGGDDNYMFVKRQGGGTATISILSEDISAGTNGIPFCWITD